jgi:uncharacterized protein YggU (UPF0235/DUF167 family)
MPSSAHRSARRDSFAPGGEEAFVARVTAPPVEDRANAVLCRLVARAADVAPSRVSVIGGRRARQKLVRVEGVGAAALRARVGEGFPRRP